MVKQDFSIKFIYLLHKESIKKREEQKLKDQEKRLQIEREILENQEDTAKLVAKAEQQRHQFHVDLEKVSNYSFRIKQYTEHT